ncbi:putative BPI/LBP family protein [Spatholobus suberectus]|nr:putative BPI/LBP family protein [Spatholobus suberectus]
MQLNIFVSSPPFIQVTYQDIGITIFVDITIDVLEDSEVIPVACISVSLMSNVLKTVILPYLNFKLKRGLPLPIIDGFGFQNANILYTQPWIAMCSDVFFLEDYSRSTFSLCFIK